jgi:ADP-ribosylation factor family
MGANLSKALGVSLPFSLEHIPVESHLGIVMATLPGRMFGNKEMRLLMLGLDAAGKTSKEPLLRPSCFCFCFFG